MNKLEEILSEILSAMKSQTQSIKALNTRLTEVEKRVNEKQINKSAI